MGDMIGICLARLLYDHAAVDLKTLSGDVPPGHVRYEESHRGGYVLYRLNHRLQDNSRSGVSWEVMSQPFGMGMSVCRQKP